MNPTHYLMALLAAVLLSACSATPTIKDTPSSEFDGLNRVSGSGFSEAWARPGAELGNYRVIAPTALQSADATIVQPTGASYSRIQREELQMTPELASALAAAWDASLRKAAADKGLLVADEGADNRVLRIDAALTRLAPNANFAEEQTTPGRSSVYTEDAGAASIEFRLVDAGSGELLAVIRDNRRVGMKSWSRANAVTAAADMRNQLNNWATRLVGRITGA